MGTPQQRGLALETFTSLGLRQQACRGSFLSKMVIRNLVSQVFKTITGLSRKVQGEGSNKLSPHSNNSCKESSADMRRTLHRLKVSTQAWKASQPTTVLLASLTTTTSPSPPTQGTTTSSSPTPPTLSAPAAETSSITTTSVAAAEEAASSQIDPAQDLPVIIWIRTTRRSYQSQARVAKEWPACLLNSRSQAARCTPR